MEKEMAVMLSKIFILLAGQPSETSSYLADMESEKKRAVVVVGRGSASIIEVLGCYQFIQGQYGRFQFVLVSRQRFHCVWLTLSSTLTLSQFLIYSQLCDTPCATSSCFWLLTALQVFWSLSAWWYKIWLYLWQLKIQPASPSATHTHTHTHRRTDLLSVCRRRAPHLHQLWIVNFHPRGPALHISWRGGYFMS